MLIVLRLKNTGLVDIISSIDATKTQRLREISSSKSNFWKVAQIVFKPRLVDSESSPFLTILQCYCEMFCLSHDLGVSHPCHDETQLMFKMTRWSLQNSGY